MNRKELAILSIITLFTVIMWITFGVFHAKQSTILTSSQLKHTLPLTPTFDQDIINQISNREE